MLSYLYRITTEYRRRHGVAPTLLYLSPRHLAQLRTELAGIEGLEGISRLLGMEMLIDREVQHPHVAWSRIGWREGAQQVTRGNSDDRRRREAGCSSG